MQKTFSLFLIVCGLLAGCAAGAGPAAVPMSPTKITAAALTDTVPPPAATDAPSAVPTVTQTAAPTFTATPRITDTPVPSETPLPTPTTVTREADGWQVFALPQDAGEIAVPPDWIPFDYNTGRLDEEAKRVTQAHPEYYEGVLNQAQVARTMGAVFYAVHFSEVGVQAGFLNNLILIRSPRPSGLAPVEFAKLVAGQIEQQPNIQKPVRITPLTLPLGPAARIDYRATIQRENGTGFTAVFSQYVFTVAGNEYSATFATTAAEADALMPVFEKIMQGLTFAQP